MELRKACFQYLFENQEFNEEELKELGSKIAIDALVVDHMSRTNEELQALQKATEKMEFFQRLNSKKINRAEKLHWKVISQMQLKFFPKGSILFNYGFLNYFCNIVIGDEADNFYLIVKGQINFFLPKKFETFCIEIKSKQQQIEEVKNKHYVSEKLRKMDILKIQELTPEFLGNLSSIEIDKIENLRDQGFNKFYFSRTLDYGQSFGELALLQRKPRSATAIAKTDVYLGEKKQ